MKPHGTKNWIYCTFDKRKKLKSNMVLALTSPLTRLKDVAKYITFLVTPLTSVKVKSNW